MEYTFQPEINLKSRRMVAAAQRRERKATETPSPSPSRPTTTTTTSTSTTIATPLQATETARERQGSTDHLASSPSPSPAASSSLRESERDKAILFLWEHFCTFPTGPDSVPYFTLEDALLLCCYLHICTLDDLPQLLLRRRPATKETANTLSDTSPRRKEDVCTVVLKFIAALGLTRHVELLQNKIDYIEATCAVKNLTVFFSSRSSVSEDQKDTEATTPTPSVQRADFLRYKADRRARRHGSLIHYTRTTCFDTFEAVLRRIWDTSVLVSASPSPVRSSPSTRPALEEQEQDQVQEGRPRRSRSNNDCANRPPSRLLAPTYRMTKISPPPSPSALRVAAATETETEKVEVRVKPWHSASRPGLSASPSAHTTPDERRATVENAEDASPLPVTYASSSSSPSSASSSPLVVPCAATPTPTTTADGGGGFHSDERPTINTSTRPAEEHKEGEGNEDDTVRKVLDMDELFQSQETTSQPQVQPQPQQLERETEGGKEDEKEAGSDDRSVLQAIHRDVKKTTLTRTAVTAAEAEAAAAARSYKSTLDYFNAKRVQRPPQPSTSPSPKQRSVTTAAAARRAHSGCSSTSTAAEQNEEVAQRKSFPLQNRNRSNSSSSGSSHHHDGSAPHHHPRAALSSPHANAVAGAAPYAFAPHINNESDRKYLYQSDTAAAVPRPRKKAHTPHVWKPTVSTRSKQTAKVPTKDVMSECTFHPRLTAPPTKTQEVAAAATSRDTTPLPPSFASRLLPPSSRRLCPSVAASSPSSSPSPSPSSSSPPPPPPTTSGNHRGDRGALYGDDAYQPFLFGCPSDGDDSEEQGNDSHNNTEDDVVRSLPPPPSLEAYALPTHIAPLPPGFETSVQRMVAARRQRREQQQQQQQQGQRRTRRPTREMEADDTGSSKKGRGRSSSAAAAAASPSPPRPTVVVPFQLRSEERRQQRAAQRALEQQQLQQQQQQQQREKEEKLRRQRHQATLLQAERQRRAAADAAAAAAVMEMAVSEPSPEDTLLLASASFAAPSRAAAAAAVAASAGSPPPHAMPALLFYLDVELPSEEEGDGVPSAARRPWPRQPASRVVRVAVYDGDSPQEVAATFGAQYKLGISMQAELEAQLEAEMLRSL